MSRSGRPQLPRPGGRIRIYPRAAALLRELLYAEKSLLFMSRRYRPDGEPSTMWNRRVKAIDQVLGELSRLSEEMGEGWDDESPANQVTEGRNMDD